MMALADSRRRQCARSSVAIDRVATRTAGTASGASRWCRRHSGADAKAARATTAAAAQSGPRPAIAAGAARGVGSWQHRRQLVRERAATAPPPPRCHRSISTVGAVRTACAAGAARAATPCRRATGASAGRAAGTAAGAIRSAMPPGS